MPVSIRWLGNAGFSIQLSQTHLLIDPFFSRPRAVCVFYGRVSPDAAAIQKYSCACDGILVSHAHYDHCMDAPEIAKSSGIPFFGSENACAAARACGLADSQAHIIHNNDQFKLHDIQISAIAAQHPWIPGFTAGKIKPDLRPPLRLQDYRMDYCFSFLLESDRTSILVWSSTSTRNARKADVLICRVVSDQSWYERLLKIVQPRWVIPSHWDDMFQPLSVEPVPFFSPPQLSVPPIQRIDMQKFAKKIQHADVQCRILLPERFKDHVLA